MGFHPISINAYVEKHLKNNKGEKKAQLVKRLKDAVKAKKTGKACSCGNSIWAIGSATSHYACFSCITGEAYPEDDYEIKEVVHL